MPAVEQVSSRCPLSACRQGFVEFGTSVIVERFEFISGDPESGISVIFRMLDDSSGFERFVDFGCF